MLSSSFAILCHGRNNNNNNDTKCIWRRKLPRIIGKQRFNSCNNDITILILSLLSLSHVLMFTIPIYFFFLFFIHCTTKDIKIKVASSLLESDGLVYFHSWLSLLLYILLLYCNIIIAKCNWKYLAIWWAVISQPCRNNDKILLLLLVECMCNRYSLYCSNDNNIIIIPF